MTTTVELRMPRHITISLGRLDEDKLVAVRKTIAEAEQAGHGLLLGEHKHMKVIEVNGITTGRIISELVLIQAADPVATLARYRTAPPDGVQVLGLIPAGMLAKAMVVAVPGAEEATASA